MGDGDRTEFFIYNVYTVIITGRETVTFRSVEMRHILDRQILK